MGQSANITGKRYWRFASGNRLATKILVLADQRASVEQVLGAFAEHIKEALRNEVKDHLNELRPVTRLILSLPIPDDLPSLDQDAKQQVADQLDTALAHGALALVEEVLDSDFSGDPKAALQEALKKGVQRGVAVAKDRIDPAAAGLKEAAEDTLRAYQKAAEEFLEEIKAAAEDASKEVKEALLRRATGVLYPLLFGEQGLAMQLAQARTLIAEIKGGRDALEAIGRQVTNALHSTAKLLVQQQAEQLCESLAERVTTLLQRMLPPANVAEEFTQALDDAAAHLSVTSDSIDPLKDTIERYGEIRKHLTDDLSKNLCEGSKPDTALAVLAVKSASELTAWRNEISRLMAAVAKDFATQLGAEAHAAATQAQVTAVNALLDQLIILAGAGTGAVLAALAAVRANIPADPSADTPLGQAVASQLRETRKTVDDAGERLTVVKRMLEFARASSTVPPVVSFRILLLTLQGARTHHEEALEKDLAQLRQHLAREFAKQEELLGEGVIAIVREIEDWIATLLGQAVSAQNAAKAALARAVSTFMRPVFTAIRDYIYVTIKKLRDDAKRALDSGATGADTITRILEALRRTLRGPNGQPLADMFSVPPIESGQDALDREIKALDGLIGATSPDVYVRSFVAFAEGWRSDTAAPLLLLRNLHHILTAVLRGDLAQFVDLHQIRREVDEAIRAMVPARIKRSFDLKLRLKADLGMLLFSGGAPEFALPRPHPKGLPDTLVLRANGIVDVLQPQNSTFDAEGYLPGFALRILPSFDVVTFVCPPTTFTCGPGKPFSISMKIEKVKLGDKVEFLRKIESILPAPKNGKGFFIDMLTGRGGTGIVAGYRLPVSPITIGNMFIDNISLNVAAELPFDKGDARFVMSVSRPEAPFMIAVAPYAGAGHFGLIANAKGIVGFEASFQFGGGGGFAFGPLKGQGRISVGIYVRKIAGLTELYGLFYAGGSARIACFGVGASLFVRLNQQDGNCEGEAIFTYSFSIGIKDIEFSVTVFKRENGSGKGDSQEAFLSPTIDLAWSEYSEMPSQKPVDKARSPKDPGRKADDASASKLPFLENRTFCMAENFAVYRSYFVHRPVLEPGRAPPSPMAKGKDKTKANQRGKAYDKSKVPETAAARPKVWVMP